VVPRAYGSHQGAPRPVRAGTKTTPPVSGTEAAIGPASDAASMRCRPSRSHWIAAPVMKIDPSNAYASCPDGPQAMVVRSPDVDRAGRSPVFMSTKDPVP